MGGYFCINFYKEKLPNKKCKLKAIWKAFLIINKLF